MAQPARKIIISVVPFEQMPAHSRARLKSGIESVESGRGFQGFGYVFATQELLWRTFSPKRIALLQAMAGQESMSIREAARRAARDVKAVHGDVQLLLAKGLLEKTDDGRVVFPYDEIHLDVVLRPLEASAA